MSVVLAIFVEQKCFHTVWAATFHIYLSLFPSCYFLRGQYLLLPSHVELLILFVHACFASSFAIVMILWCLFSFVYAPVIYFSSEGYGFLIANFVKPTLIFFCSRIEIRSHRLHHRYIIKTSNVSEFKKKIISACLIEVQEPFCVGKFINGCFSEKLLF